MPTGWLEAFGITVTMKAAMVDSEIDCEMVIFSTLFWKVVVTHSGLWREQ